MKDAVAKDHYWSSMCAMFGGQSMELARRWGPDGLGAGMAFSQAGKQDRRRGKADDRQATVQSS